MGSGKNLPIKLPPVRTNTAILLKTQAAAYLYFLKILAPGLPYLVHMESEFTAPTQNTMPSPAVQTDVRHDLTPSAPMAHGGNIVRTLINKLRIPATESQLSLALGLSVLVMSGLLWAILWQSNIIVQQRESIRYLLGLHGGHIG
jgi:hypothetical protein